MPTSSDSPSKPTVAEILADYAARLEGPMSAVYRLLEHVEHEADLDRLFAQMPVRLQRATIEMAIVYRDKFDELLECFGPDVDAHRIRAAFEQWARSQPEVVEAVARPRGRRTLLERIATLEQLLMKATSDADRTAFAAKLQQLTDAARDDDSDLVTGLAKIKADTASNS